MNPVLSRVIRWAAPISAGVVAFGTVGFLASRDGSLSGDAALFVLAALLWFCWWVLWIVPRLRRQLVAYLSARGVYE